jgi:hypothetical protein
MRAGAMLAGLSVLAAAIASISGTNAMQALPSGLAGDPAAGNSDAHIYTWIGNTPAWNRKLHVSGYRMGCDAGDPEGCVRDAAQAVAQSHLKTIFLSMFIDPAHTLSDARVYSLLSLSYPFIAEAGFDDFVGRYDKLIPRPGFDPPSWLREVVHNVKAENPNLGFGITVYEDELDSPYLRPPALPADVARNVDFVHFFLHYRTDAARYAGDVDRVKALFPHAKIIAGIYAYDRINYIPCSPANARPCSPDEEIGLYKQALSIDASLLKQGRIAGIEFYPGFFGKENEWGGWKHSDYCSPERVQQCIENTLTMRKSTLDILGAAMGW